MARDYLYEAYQQKADLLAQMSDRGDPTDDDSPSPQIPRRSVAWKAAGVLVPGLSCSVPGPALADHIEKHFKVDAHPVITLHNPNGTITVKAWTKSEVMVIATRATSQVEIDAEQTGNRVDVMTHQFPTAVAREYAGRLRNRVPEDAELQIHDDSGAVNVDTCSAI